MYLGREGRGVGGEPISTVGQFLSQPNPNRVAEPLTWVRRMHPDHVWSAGSGPQTINLPALHA